MTAERLGVDQLAQPLRSSGAVRLPHGVAGAGDALPTSAPVSLPDVIAGECVAVGAVRLTLVREPTFPRSIEEIVALGADEQVVRAHATAIVAAMTENLAGRHRAVF